MPAELCGKFLFDIENTSNFPTVGDWVTIQALSDNALALIHSVLPRKTLLKCKEAGRKIAFQLIAANIDIGLIVQPADQINLLDGTVEKRPSSVLFSKFNSVTYSYVCAFIEFAVRLESGHF